MLGSEAMYDVSSGTMSGDDFTGLLSAAAGVTLLGIDEDTALVRAGDGWQVSGRQSVVVFDGDRRQSYGCEPVCQSIIMMGDDAAFTGETVGSSQTVAGVAQSN